VPELKDYIDDNLDQLAGINPGERLRHDPARPGRLRRDGSDAKTALARRKEDSILNDERYLKPITALFREAVTSRSGRTAKLSRALPGIRNLLQTYSGTGEDKQKRRQKVQQILDAATEIVQGCLWPPEKGRKLPDEPEWFKMLQLAQVPVSPALQRVGDLLGLYMRNRKNNPYCTVVKGDLAIRTYLRIDIYMTLRHVLNTVGRLPQGVRAVHDLAESKCCRIFGQQVTPPQMQDKVRERLLRQLWDENPDTPPHLIGKVKQRDGDKVAKTYYLEKAALKKYELVFASGLIRQFRWWGDAGPWSDTEADYEKDLGGLELVPADSFFALERTPVGMEGGRRQSEILADRTSAAGNYVLGFDRKFYMAQHQSPLNIDTMEGRRPFFHSSYFKGAGVLCAGNMIIVNGQLRMISNNSGHYRPKAAHLVSALEALLMHGVSLTNVWAHYMNEQMKERLYPAECFLRKRGKVTWDEGHDPSKLGRKVGSASVSISG
jgi:hypothetical protein